MSTLQASRRTPLGLLHAAAEANRPFDWNAPNKGHVHVISDEKHRFYLYDLTPFPRFGLKGRGSADWLAAQGVGVPERINSWNPAVSGEFDILRLGTDDLVLLSRPDAPSPSLAALRAEWERATASPKGFDAWRDEVWAWFHLSGEGLPGFMARTCPVDLRAEHFPVGQIAQTRVAHMDVVVARTDRAGRHGFDLLFDIASSDFMLQSLKDLGDA